jgi:hypothetical protein
MGNERQLKLATQFVAVRDVNEYRATIPAWVSKEDVVLEIGCEWGTTTALLAQHAKEVIGTDISPECIERARRTHPGVRFEVLDGFDARAALGFGKAFTKVYIDMSGLSGYRSLLDAISLMMMYATVFRPAAIVIKSGALKHFASHCVAWRPAAARPEAAE